MHIVVRIVGLFFACVAAKAITPAAAVYGGVPAAFICGAIAFGVIMLPANLWARHIKASRKAADPGQLSTG